MEIVERFGNKILVHPVLKPKAGQKQQEEKTYEEKKTFSGFKKFRSLQRHDLLLCI